MNRQFREGKAQMVKKYIKRSPSSLGPQEMPIYMTRTQPASELNGKVKESHVAAREAARLHLPQRWEDGLPPPLCRAVLHAWGHKHARAPRIPTAQPTQALPQSQRMT